MKFLISYLVLTTLFILSITTGFAENRLIAAAFYVGGLALVTWVLNWLKKEKPGYWEKQKK
jgi:uncharacterized membrane protein YciS (DUF1049 family)